MLLRTLRYAVIQSVPLATEPGISLIILTPMKILQRNLNRSTFVVWEMKRNVSVVHQIVVTRSSGPPASQHVSCLTRLSAHNWSHLLRRNHQNSCIYGNLQHLCKSIGRWGTLSWVLSAGWSDIPHFTRQHGPNSVPFRRQRHFEGTLATALARSDAAWLFLMGMSERESLPKQTTNHSRLESKYHRRNSGSNSGRNGKDFPKYGAPGSILSGRKWWHFQHMLWCHHISYTLR